MLYAEVTALEAVFDKAYLKKTDELFDALSDHKVCVARVGNAVAVALDEHGAVSHAIRHRNLLHGDQLHVVSTVRNGRWEKLHLLNPPQEHALAAMIYPPIVLELISYYVLTNDIHANLVTLIKTVDEQRSLLRASGVDGGSKYSGHYGTMKKLHKDFNLMAYVLDDCKKQHKARFASLSRAFKGLHLSKSTNKADYSIRMALAAAASNRAAVEKNLGVLAGFIWKWSASDSKGYLKSFVTGDKAWEAWKITLKDDLPDGHMIWCDPCGTGQSS